MVFKVSDVAVVSDVQLRRYGLGASITDLASVRPKFSVNASEKQNRTKCVHKGKCIQG